MAFCKLLWNLKYKNSVTQDFFNTQFIFYFFSFCLICPAFPFCLHVLLPIIMGMQIRKLENLSYNWIIRYQLKPIIKNELYPRLLGKCEGHTCILLSWLTYDLFMIAGWKVERHSGWNWNRQLEGSCKSFCWSYWCSVPPEMAKSAESRACKRTLDKRG